MVDAWEGIASRGIVPSPRKATAGGIGGLGCSVSDRVLQAVDFHGVALLPLNQYTGIQSLPPQDCLSVGYFVIDRHKIQEVHVAPVKWMQECVAKTGL